MRNGIWKYSELEKLLERDFPLVRRWAFEKLANTCSSSRTGRIAALIDDGDEYISSGAVRYLAAHGHKKWAFRILRKFEDTTGLVAANCAMALGELRYTDALPFFVQRVEKEEADFETLMGIISALRMMPCDESTQLLTSIGEIYYCSSNGVFLAKICDALLLTRHRDALRFVAKLFMERAFSLDDHGAGILRSLIHHTHSLQFIDEFHSFTVERPYDVLRYIKESVRHRLGEILGDEFVAKTGEKFLKLNYGNLLSDIRRTAEMALYSRKLVDSDADLEKPEIAGQELFNYHCIDCLTGESRLLNVMSLGEMKKIIILSICSLLRIVYSKKSAAPVDVAGTKDTDLLLASLPDADFPDVIIKRIVELAEAPGKKPALRDKVVRRIRRNGKPHQTIRYLTLLRELQAAGPQGDLEVFWDHLDIKHSDAVCSVAEEAMVAAGKHAVDFIEDRFASGDESQKMFGLGILSRIPVRKSVDLILRSLDDMWDGYRDFILYAVNELGSRKFIGPIMKKLLESESGGYGPEMSEDPSHHIKQTVSRSPNSDLEETCLLLCELHGIDDERFDGVRARITKELESADGPDGVDCDRSKALRHNHCNRKLICRHCDLSRRLLAQ